MKFEDALKKLGGESVGGQLIVHRNSKNILVGKSVQGLLIVEDNDEAKLIAAEIGVEVEAEITTHVLTVDDNVKMEDAIQLPAPPPPQPDPKSKK